LPHQSRCKCSPDDSSGKNNQRNHHRNVSREPRHAVRVGSFVKEQLSVPEHGKPLFLVRVGSLIK
ncbi:MAG TPA: hypothetical protein PK270_07835, partial [Ruminococcus bromii]|nr:hypothetical protein [Ruminococcus bromii]